MEKHSRWPKQIFNNAIKNQVGRAANSELLSIRSSIIRGQKAAPPDFGKLCSKSPIHLVFSPTFAPLTQGLVMP